MFLLYTSCVTLVLLSCSHADTAGKQYIAEGYIVFEDSVLDMYRPYDAVNAEKDMLHDSEYFFTFTNYLYSTLQNFGLDIQVRFIKVDVLDVNVLSPRKGATTLNKADVLGQFKDWLKKTDAEARLDYDFALLFSGKKLSGINGIASTGVICDKSMTPTTVITFGGQATAVTQTHEISHIFGALHNGKEGHHVMRSARSYDYMERFTFSECTATDIKQYLDRNSDACLLETKVSSWTPDVPVEKYNGRLFNEDTLCRQVYGPGSFACNIPKDDDDRRTQDEDPECLSIYCQNPDITDRLSCHLAQTPEGMPCDKNKVCKLGHCVADSSSKFAQAIEPGCMLGDQIFKFVQGRRLSCEEAFDELGPALCGGGYYQCCSFCAKKRRASGGDCVGDYSSLKVDDDYVSCSAAIDIIGATTLCKNSYGKKRCCETCARRKVTDNCYGDASSVSVGQTPYSCSRALQLVGDNLCNNSYGKGRCCETCLSYSRGKRSTEAVHVTDTDTI